MSTGASSKITSGFQKILPTIAEVPDVQEEIGLFLETICQTLGDLRSEQISLFENIEASSHDVKAQLIDALAILSKQGKAEILSTLAEICRPAIFENVFEVVDVLCNDIPRARTIRELTDLQQKLINLDEFDRVLTALKLGNKEKQEDSDYSWMLQEILITMVDLDEFDRVLELADLFPEINYGYHSQALLYAVAKSAARNHFDEAERAFQLMRDENFRAQALRLIELAKKETRLSHRYKY